MRKFLSLFTAALLALSVNAAVINIDNTSADALRLALNNAASGDIIEMAAGTYVESNGDYIAFAGKDVTVRAAEGAEVILQPQVPVQITEGGCAHFQNIKIDASRLVELADWYEHLMYPADAANNSIVLEGCELYGFNINKSMLYCNTSNKLAAVTINNCYFHNIEKSVLFVENSTEAINVQVTNSTFANIIASVTDSYWAGIIDVRASGATLLVDHCTFYNVIPMNTDYSCVSKITLANGNASNCIFMLPTAQDGIRAMRGVTATNCITYNYLKDSGTGIHSSVTKVNCVQVDPLFVDAANGNFALSEGSPALTMNDGQPIGDPRWVAAAPQPADPTVSVRGTMNEWGETPFELSADKTYATLTIDDIPAGDYQFKMFINGEWRSNGYTFHRGFTGAAGITGNDDNNMVFQADVRGAYTFTWTFANDSLGFVYPEAAPQPEETVVYNWSTGEDAVGTTILGGNSNISVSNVKIHTNTDQVDALKFGSSFVYADGKWVAIKPAEGTFKAGDVLSVAVVFNNSDDTKYCMVDLRAANGDTRIWMSDSLSTINGRTSAADPIVQTYTLAADADSLFIGRYGNTGMCLTLLKVVRPAGVTPQPADPTVSVRGSMNEWGETPFELSADKTYATLVVNDIPAGDYQFKMFINGEWRSNGYTFHRGFTGAAGITGNDDNNMVFQADVRGAYTFTWTFANDSLGFVYPEAAPQPEETVVYNWSTGEDAVGTTILGGNSNISVSNVKIHTNTDQVDALKFGSSFVYADGKWVAIKPAEGTFKAGDVLSVAVVFNNSDDTKYCMVDLRAANGDTRIWMSDSLSTINGRTSAADPIVQTYTLAADADSLFIGRYGNTGMCLTLLKVVRPAGVTPQPVEHTYTVAGGSDAAFGAAWAPTAEANDMALVEGLYTWEKANITLAAGNIEFKVCEDHAWTNCWPSDNYVLNIPEAGIYTITITFNADSKEVAAIATKTGDAVVIPSIAMHGNFLGSWADTQNFEIAEGNATASLTLNIAAGNYEFGMRIGGSGNWTANGAAFTRENASAVIVAGSGNLTLAADVAGDYVFTWTYETNTLAITFPAAAPAEGPSAAPAEPTWPANQVKAVYSATYNADCGFGEWGSATQYSQDTYGKKYVTAGGGYFGLTFEGDAALNCSKMEALHLDIWIAEDASVGIVPIHGGAEVRVTKNLVGQQWNSFDIALTEFENGTDWTNTYQIKLDNISNKTFWVNNVYFYTTQAPAADTEAPTDVTASLASASYFSATITATATDNSDAVKFYVMDSEQELAVVNAVSGVAKEIVVKGLLPNTAYNFSVIAKDEAGNAAAPVAVAATTLAAPAPAEAPTYAADKVLGIQTDVYTNLAYGIQDWWSMPAATVGNLTATSKALCIEATSATPAGSCFGLAFAPTDITAYDALEMDVYAVAEGAAIKIQVIGDNANLPAATVYNLVAGQWNHVVLNIAGNTKNNCEQIGFYDCQLMAGPIFVQNVLFVQNDAPVVETNYYLVGTITDWAVVADDAHTFVANASVEGEYMLTTTLAEGDGIKVVGVRGETQTWYPDGMGNEYVVDAAHAGKVNIYFRPAGNADWAAFGGFIYIDVDHTSIDNTFVDANAVKVLRDGQLLIIKGEKTFNAQGQLVK